MKRAETVRIVLILGISAPVAFAQKAEKEFSSALMQDTCEYSSTGRSAYFILIRHQTTPTN